ncbi:hypothetical protein MAPG_07096 [Magnaporthiopsis poae ATCC 64411]|uniref:Uncharacterized protein n=1 Tax=Magnaporthiopsis poae (strain ATCC 64411 / 73-15) TaxID=644358 RepID=A0A0C4E3S7_MAGP6|nr:hypothetical protein MAPG_07096 [Magnaporthiopsis poae ATCC 64411]
MQPPHASPDDDRRGLEPAAETGRSRGRTVGADQHSQSRGGVSIPVECVSVPPPAMGGASERSCLCVVSCVCCTEMETGLALAWVCNPLSGPATEFPISARSPSATLSLLLTSLSVLSWRRR